MLSPLRFCPLLWATHLCLPLQLPDLAAAGVQLRLELRTALLVGGQAGGQPIGLGELQGGGRGRRG